MLLGLNWSTFHYKPVGIRGRDVQIMAFLDKQYTATPFYGVLKMAKALTDAGLKVGKDHARTLLRRMGLVAVYPRKNTSKPHPDHKIYPYLLRGVEILRTNQVWSADITYVRLVGGFAYLTAIIDWRTRFVLSWRLSNTLDSGTCMEALAEALARYGNPEIFNTDQGSQFTSDKFTGMLAARGILISMDGRGRAHDNIFVERLWRTVKYEDIFLKGYGSIPEARAGLEAYFEFYNNRRYHQSLDYRTPAQEYFGTEICGRLPPVAGRLEGFDNFTLGRA